jgi:hypothetical protein
MNTPKKGQIRQVPAVGGVWHLIWWRNNAQSAP